MEIIRIKNRGDFKTTSAIQFVYHLNIENSKIISMLENIESKLVKVNCYTTSVSIYYTKKKSKLKIFKDSVKNREKYFPLIEGFESLDLTFDSSWKLSHYDLFTDKFDFYIEFCTKNWDGINGQLSISIDSKKFTVNTINIAELFLDIFSVAEKFTNSIVYAYSFEMDKFFFPQMYLHGGEYVFDNEIEKERNCIEVKLLHKYVKNIAEFNSKIWHICGINVLNPRQIKDKEKVIAVLEKEKCEFINMENDLLFFKLPNYKCSIGNEDKKIVDCLLPYLNC